MQETDSKKQEKAPLTQQYTLTEQDLRKMIAEKFERARAYSEALARKREVVLDSR